MEEYSNKFEVETTTGKHTFSTKEHFILGWVSDGYLMIESYCGVKITYPRDNVVKVVEYPSNYKAKWNRKLKKYERITK